jgi:hypothetical protein
MRRALSLFVLCLVVCAVVPSLAQPVMFPSVRSAVIWKASGDFQRAIELAIVYRQAKDRIGQMVSNARQRYWAQDPNGANLEAARQEYSDALFTKDLWNADVYVVQGALTDVSLGPAGRKLQQMMGIVDGVTGGTVEPTHALARKEFQDWASMLVTTRLRASRHTVSEADLRATEAAFERYAARRDLAESLFRNPGSALVVPNAPPLEYLAAWMVATGEVATYADAGKYLGELQAAVGDARVSDAARIVRSYTTVGSGLEGPLTRMPIDYLDHVTGRRRRDDSFVTPLAPRLSGIDQALFPLRARLFGLNEDAAFDRIRELLYRVEIAQDPEAIRLAVAEKDALIGRFRRRFGSSGSDRISEIGLTDSMLTNSLAVADQHAYREIVRAAWAGLPKGQSVPYTPPVDLAARVQAELTTYRGPTSARFQVCRLTGAPGVVIDGLPPGDMMVVFEGAPVKYQFLPGAVGRQRLQFTDGLCATGTWAPAGSAVASAAVTAQAKRVFDSSRATVQRAGEAARFDAMAEAWSRYETAKDPASRAEAARLRRELLSILRPRDDLAARQAVSSLDHTLEFIAEPYTGPTSGEIVWTGEGQRSLIVEVDGTKVSAGKLQGGLPGVPVRLEVVEQSKGTSPVDIIGHPTRPTDFRQFRFMPGLKVKKVVIRWTVIPAR